MADEARIYSGLQIKKDNIDYRGQPVSFLGDVTGSNGPVVGAINVTTSGTDVDLSQLTTPGYVRFQNLDLTNFVEYGIYDTESGIFFPLGEILPGETYVIRFSRNLQEEYPGTGTGTTGPTNRLHFKANTAACKVLIEAFEA